MSQIETDVKTDVKTDLERPVETTDEGDHDRFAHVVVPASAVTEAYITGQPVTALCGKTWVPSRNPERYPICPTCKEILQTAQGLGGG
ncbi:MAG: hypothetical protein JWM05_3333 [Acidimicrobiales bacterium]|nr:hypothetical protein [Acidimicrobiales bacterium]